MIKRFITTNNLYILYVVGVNDDDDDDDGDDLKSYKSPC